MEVIAVKTDLIGVGGDLPGAIRGGLSSLGQTLHDGDVLIVSESAVATWQGRVVNLSDIVPGEKALALARRYQKDPREMELILSESDSIEGGIPGVVLTMNGGFLYPNAGIDHSNAPQGHVVLFPDSPQKAASDLRDYFATSYGAKIAVIIGDSRTHPLRLGCVGVALACVGMDPVEDARGQADLYGRPLMITRKAVADNLVSAAQVVMGEGDEGIPAVVIRGAPVKIHEDKCMEAREIPRISPEDCMYIGALRSGPRPYKGGYEELIKSATSALKDAYAPYSRFRVGAALLGRSGRIYSAGNVENASPGAGLCAERAAISIALACGESGFEALAVVGDTEKIIAPCGICRQMIIEFGEDINVIMASISGDATIATAAELLPSPFTATCLDHESTKKPPLL